MNRTSIDTLLLPSKPDLERESIARAFTSLGGRVLWLDRFWEPPNPGDARVAVYGNDTFCLVLAEVLGLALVSPRDDVLGELPQSWLQRDLWVRTLEELPAVRFPCFIKPLTPKLFVARVYDDLDAVRRETEGLELASPIYCAEVVSFICEVRAFICEREVCDFAVYEGALPSGASPLDFIADVIQSGVWPSTYVLDVGFVGGRGWCVIEANASWGAGLNGCDAERVLPAILAATHS